MLLKPFFKSVKQTLATDKAETDQLTIPFTKLLWPQVNKKRNPCGEIYPTTY